MGGRIWARPLDGKGAEFGFSIPAYVDEFDLGTSSDEPSHVFERAPEPFVTAPAAAAAAVATPPATATNGAHPAPAAASAAPSESDTTPPSTNPRNEAPATA